MLCLTESCRGAYDMEASAGVDSEKTWALAGGAVLPGMWCSAVVFGLAGLALSMRAARGAPNACQKRAVLRSTRICFRVGFRCLQVAIIADVLATSWLLQPTFVKNVHGGACRGLAWAASIGHGFLLRGNASWIVPLRSRWARAPDANGDSARHYIRLVPVRGRRWWGNACASGASGLAPRVSIYSCFVRAARSLCKRAVIAVGVIRSTFYVLP
jgi:hypothetical protein